MKLGRAARYIRKQAGLTQIAAAERLGFTNVHLCNIEHDKRVPSLRVVEKYQEVFGVDLYITAWLLFGDVKKLPPILRGPTKDLARIWKREWRKDLREVK